MSLMRNVNKINVNDLFDIRQTQIGIAKKTLAEEQLNGFPKTGYITLVDNKETTDLTRLKPYGKIAYFAPQQLKTVAVDALNLLIQYSPLGRGSAANRTGRYFENHIVIFNKQVLTTQGSLIAALNSNTPRDFSQDEILIVNTQPYARKIERGHSDQTPKGVYKRVSNILKRKYGGIAFISQKYVAASSVPGLKAAIVTRTKKTRGGAPQQVAQAYPAIRIKRGRGTSNV